MGWPRPNSDRGSRYDCPTMAPQWRQVIGAQCPAAEEIVPIGSPRCTTVPDANRWSTGSKVVRSPPECLTVMTPRPAITPEKDTTPSPALTTTWPTVADRSTPRCPDDHWVLGCSY